MKRRLFLKIFGLAPAFPLLSWGKSTEHAIVDAIDVRQTTMWTLASTDTDPAPRITLVACGGAGIAMTRGIDKARYGLHEVIAIDTSKRALARAAHADKRLLVTTGDGRKPESADEAWFWAGEHWTLIEDLIGDPHVLIVVTGLGGSAGTGISGMVAYAARSKGILTFAFATQPFEFEGEKRHYNGNGGLCMLAEYSDNVLSVANDRLFESPGSAPQGHDVFQGGTAALKQYLWHTSIRLTRDGLVSPDYTDIDAVFAVKDRTCTSKIGWGEASGVMRGTRAVRAALHHPLLQSAENRITGVSVAFRASRNSLSYKEVMSAMNEVKTTCPEEALIIFRADYDDSLDDRMQVSVVLNREDE